MFYTGFSCSRKRALWSGVFCEYLLLAPLSKKLRVTHPAYPAPRIRGQKVREMHRTSATHDACGTTETISLMKRGDKYDGKSTELRLGMPRLPVSMSIALRVPWRQATSTF